MANRFQQMAQQRKLVYAGLILALFTVSLLHKKVVIEKNAFDLQLRETARGDVELTSSVVRLTLTGSRGLAVTILWAAAIEKQKKHNLNEVELLVDSITTLQPYFITPWIFQSWNLAFNVAVECDRPIDKYYYISKGIQMLAKGERFNQGVENPTTGQSLFPGNPDMRHHLGMTYQLKLGSSDEKYTMRSLLELSCIDPVLRDPERFRQVGSKDSPYNLDELEKFCRANPRLVRRLREYLHFENEKQLVDFLVSTKSIPSRFEERGNSEETPVKGKKEEPKKPERWHIYQFPSLPRQIDATWPDTTNWDLTTKESANVYLMSRTWFQYAQKPLPKPARLEKGLKFDPLVDRLPKQMALKLFRATPCRAQAFIAEVLEEEGFFDSEGWEVPDWFQDRNVIVGTEDKYHAGPVWTKAHEMYLDFGKENGLYLTAEERQKLENEAQPFRDLHGVGVGTRVNLKSKGFEAHEQLYENLHYRGMTNYDAHLYQAQAEQTKLAVLARKIYHKGLRAMGASSAKNAIEYYQRAAPLWMEVLLANPDFAKVSNTQEETYEQELKFLRFIQLQPAQAASFRNAILVTRQALAWPYLPMSGSLIVLEFKQEDEKVTTRELFQWPFLNWEKLLNKTEYNKIARNRYVRGAFDTTQYYDAPDAPALKDALLLWTQGASVGAGLAPPLLLPTQKNWALVRCPLGETVAPAGWKYLVDDQAVGVVRDRAGFNR